MSRKYTNKELVAELNLRDTVLRDITNNAYEYMEIIGRNVELLKDKTDESSVRQLNAWAQTMGMVNFLVHPAHEISKKYYPNLIAQIDEYKTAYKKGFDLGYVVCHCDTQCDPGKIKLQKIIKDHMEKLEASKKEMGDSNGEGIQEQSVSQS
jgi:hypothetical protein